MKVVLVDDHHVVRKGLRYFLESQKDLEIVAEAENGEEAVKVVEDTKPDVVLMDLIMPKKNGIEATREITTLFPTTKVIILTSFADQEHVIPALQAGASGYQLKDIEPDELAETIRAVHSGESKLHNKVTKYVLTRITAKETEEEKLVKQLTKREKDVLIQISMGKSNKEIASSLVISEKTVKTHVSNILGKLQLADRTQAAIFAMKFGLSS
ncbi:response regulator [Litchfieldia alkalitelluris]|uniref:response regulator n=1 Tax=Litchfieldia alkalitelluris TaxID=304268 RepID=UPI0014737200|nr:response regulator transcription factor [Litchfieldia alkalitelluris]